MYPKQLPRCKQTVEQALAIDKGIASRAVYGGLLLFALLDVGNVVMGQMAGHGVHPPMPNQHFALSCSLGDTTPTAQTIAIDLANPSAPATLKQAIELQPGWPAIRVTRFLPQADLRQVVAADDAGQGKPAIQLSITGPTQTIDRWLIANDMQRNRLASYIGTWRFMDVADRAQRKKLLKQFKNELTREPMLLIRNADGETVESLPAVAGKSARLGNKDTSIRVISFYPHFGVDQDTKKPVNQSDKRLNPVVLVEIDLEGSKRKEWIFSRFPDYRQHQDNPLPFQLTLDCPSLGSRAVPDFLIVSTNGKKCELAVRYEGKTSFRSLSVDDSVEVLGSQYRFSMASMFPSGKLTEIYEPSKGRGVPALRVEAAGDAKAFGPVWLELGKPKIMLTSNGPITLTFHLDERQGAKGHP